MTGLLMQLPLKLDVYERFVIKPSLKMDFLESDMKLQYTIAWLAAAAM